MIELSGITYAYDGGPAALDGLDWRLLPGERVGIVGPNGSGKSTLFMVTLGLMRPRAGRVTIFGRERRTEADFRAVRGRVGLLFQNSDDQLFCPTVAEDVAFGPLNLGKTREEALEIVGRTLKLLGLEGFEHRYCHKLSGGEKRLVSLATVLAMEPEVLLLDEPTAGLDEQTTDRLADFLRCCPQTWAMVSHDRGFVTAVADRVVQMRGGRIAS